MLERGLRSAGWSRAFFFRAETSHEAISLGLSGWVRNVPNGNVEAVFEGGRAAVLRAIEWCAKGPPHARVDSVDVVWEEPSGQEGFTIRYR